MATPTLSVEHISKEYDGHRALTDISLEVPSGSIYGLLGPNGAGKTSLIRIVNQITAPDQGRVLLHGKPLQESDIQHIGYLPEERGLYPKMKVGEQLLYLAQLKGMSKKEALESSREWCEKLEVSSWWNKRIEQLSKGMAQKIQFISTVVHRPKLLILDEPFSGFDPINTQQIKAEIRGLAEAGATILLSTHRMESVEEICSAMSMINKSELVLQGAVREIRERYKGDSYTAEIRRSEALSELNLSQVVVEKQSFAAGIQYLKLRSSLSGNQVLAQLMPLGELSHFAEELPSLNDIFIQTVQAHA